MPCVCVVARYYILRLMRNNQLYVALLGLSGAGSLVMRTSGGASN
ncbi:hypothetical protein SAMN04488238_11813 [Roseicitreum antarcticum]|uniref:Uncharacterized protein n=1 Tax=Roseicitreum antarcticum TaxID=564137 RepID=A0A1H3E542_9RHOB|nr:hypothetical protein SAMN04488238_11813 [Roseicitreum antarcticum]